MQVLLDECVDRRLAGEITGHQVQTVPRMGWAGKRNGELLKLAEGQFDVFVTVDRVLPKQHDIPQYSSLDTADTSHQWDAADIPHQTGMDGVDIPQTRDR